VTTVMEWALRVVCWLVDSTLISEH